MTDLRDATLREGLDVPGVSFDLDERLRIAAALAAAGVREAEVVAPARVSEDVEVAAAIKKKGVPLRSSGLVYANRPQWREDALAAESALDRVDLLMPLSAGREPAEPTAKAERIEEAVGACRQLELDVGAGFPHATQVPPAFVVDMARRAAAAGADRITVYDTNGSSDPFAVTELVASVAGAVDVAVFFHAHNDLGLATANSLAAVRAGAAGLDVTVNGLGDRAGNASLEQVVVLLEQRGFDTGVDLAALHDLCVLVAECAGVDIPSLAPVVGRFAFDHRSPAHLAIPEEFEAIDPARLGGQRKISKR